MIGPLNQRGCRHGCAVYQRNRLAPASDLTPHALVATRMPHPSQQHGYTSRSAPENDVPGCTVPTVPLPPALDAASPSQLGLASCTAGGNTQHPRPRRVPRHADTNAPIQRAHRCATCRMVPPGVSYTPRDFMPTKRDSTRSTRPMPFWPARASGSGQFERWLPSQPPVVGAATLREPQPRRSTPVMYPCTCGPPSS